MKRIFFFLAILATTSVFVSCDKDDDDHMDDDPQYSITFNSPTTDDKNLNDDIHIHVDFISGNDMTVHHVNLKIYNKADDSIVIFDGPTDAHVMEASGKFELHADLSLDNATGVQEHTDWIVEAKVWGHEAGAAEVTEMMEFHVHPE